MTIVSHHPGNNAPLEKYAAIHDVTTLFNGARPPLQNDVLPLFRSALVIPLVQPLPALPTLKWLYLTHLSGCHQVFAMLWNAWTEPTSNLKSADVA